MDFTKSSSKKDFISVIIRGYNSGNFIFNAINSALVQTISNYEIILINDGSTDNTSKIISSFKDHKLKIINQENLGAFESGYVGLRASSGDKIIFL